MGVWVYRGIGLLGIGGGYVGREERYYQERVYKQEH
jgi:hypothetical protein